MATISKPNTFSAGATIVASEHNDNFDTIYNDYNGNITNVNIAAGAAIVDTKLATISTAGKVNGAALTGLASVPAGAGDLPEANLPASITQATTFTDLTATTADINGGTVDGTNIGVSSQGTAHVSTLKVGTTNQGDVLYDNGTSLVRLTPGTNGQFLQTQGAAANPQWASLTSRYSLLDSGTTTTASSFTVTETLSAGTLYKFIWEGTCGTASDAHLTFNGDNNNHFSWGRTLWNNSGTVTDADWSDRSSGENVFLLDGTNGLLSTRFYAEMELVVVGTDTHISWTIKDYGTSSGASSITKGIGGWTDGTMTSFVIDNLTNCTSQWSLWSENFS